MWRLLLRYTSSYRKLVKDYLGIIIPKVYEILEKYSWSIIIILTTIKIHKVTDGDFIPLKIKTQVQNAFQRIFFIFFLLK